jgi:phosphoesterase RecJ-like protein
LVVVDVSVLNRLGDTMPVFGHADQTLIIDHHDGYDGLGSYALVDPDAAACSLLVWNLILASGVAPTVRMAEYCYLGLMTDTGRFAYQNTSAACFTAAAQMVQAGARPERMYARIYSNKPLAVLQLESRLLERMQLACDGAVASSYLSDADLSELGIVREQTEELPSFLRSIEGVRVSALFRSQSDGVRVNLRSEDGFNVGDFAQRFGGGGHPGAAGISLSLPFEEAMEQIVAALIQDYSTH